jgi:hypothetical protein
MIARLLAGYPAGLQPVAATNIQAKMNAISAMSADKKI